jgi:hypothetical protein
MLLIHLVVMNWTASELELIVSAFLCFCFTRHIFHVDFVFQFQYAVFHQLDCCHKYTWKSITFVRVRCVQHACVVEVPCW